jgi:hypothetical protein
LTGRADIPELMLALKAFTMQLEVSMTNGRLKISKTWQN